VAIADISGAGRERFGIKHREPDVCCQHINPQPVVPTLTAPVFTRLSYSTKLPCMTTNTANQTSNIGLRAGIEHLSGLIERVTFHSDDSGFCVLRVKARGHRDQVTIVGTLPQVKTGEWLEAEGKWTIDRDHGQQFKAEMLRTTPPNTIEGIEKYLASGLIKGIGPVFANRLVKNFGEQVLEIIENHADRLFEVDGIGPVRQEKITHAWQEQRIVKNIMVFLHSHGVSASRAFRIYKTYGDEAVEKVAEDPYQLARDIHGIGFRTADKIAESLGIEKQSELRARVGIEYVLQELTNEGHCGYPRDKLVKAAVTMLEIPEPIVQTSVDQTIQQQRIVEHNQDNGTVLVYLAGLEHAEQKIAACLADLCQIPHPCPNIRIEKAIQWVEQKISLDSLLNSARLSKWLLTTRLW